MQETRVQSFGWEDPLEEEEEMATHSSIPTWEILWIEETGGSQEVRHDWACMHHTPPYLSSSDWENREPGKRDISEEKDKYR